MIPILLFASGLGAGAFGALLGIGGGIILVPLLNFGFGLPLGHAVAIALACVIATSSGAAATYVKDHRCDVRLGMKLEIFTVAGALAGAFVAPFMPRSALQILFGLMIVPVTWSLLRKAPSDGAASFDGQSVPVRNLPLGCGVSFAAGSLSALLGIGGGPIKVPAMNLLMGVPFKVATATSNFMIGVTAAASVFVYYARGMLDVGMAAPTVLGVILGATVGARLMPHVPTRRLKQVYSVLLVLLGAEMISKGLDFDLWRML
ncbi:sulfite exporter TauE/SafE family protein [Vulgatibacter incomptus]|uniref:Probable membrane transporter protein n=1 Tax=Vulgatibacter incomptus TaxID=1391653 RepID=A0A0K1PI86_9BACT|nr:sulfite exporter TauE/SafE family protein [Vulgatibacter incomptus]AKU92824.1 putative membrane protein [Vulgatibacter incomptus]